MKQPEIIISNGQTGDAFSFVHIRHESYSGCMLIYQRGPEDFEVESKTKFKTKDDAIAYCRAELFSRTNQFDMEMFISKIESDVKEASLKLDMRIANLRGLLFGQILKLKGSIAW